MCFLQNLCVSKGRTQEGRGSCTHMPTGAVVHMLSIINANQTILQLNLQALKCSTCSSCDIRWWLVGHAGRCAASGCTEWVCTHLICYGLLEVCDVGPALASKLLKFTVVVLRNHPGHLRCVIHGQCRRHCQVHAWTSISGTWFELRMRAFRYVPPTARGQMQ